MQPLPIQALKPLDMARMPAAKPMALSAADLDPISRLTGGAAVPTKHEQLVKQTQNWVAQTFFASLLKQMRNSPFKSEIFSGGRGGEAFGGMYDQQLAQRMAGASGAKLVNSIVRKIEANAAYAQANPAKASKDAPTAAGKTDNHTQERAVTMPQFNGRGGGKGQGQSTKDASRVAPTLRA